MQGVHVPIEMVGLPADYRLDLVQDGELKGWCVGSLPGGEACYEVREVPEPDPIQLLMVGLFGVVCYLLGEWRISKRASRMAAEYVRVSKRMNRQAEQDAKRLSEGAQVIESLRAELSEGAVHCDVRDRPGLQAVTRERCKQVLKYDRANDAKYLQNELPLMAAEMICFAIDRPEIATLGTDYWNLADKHGHDSDKLLAIAGALVCAELDRRAAHEAS